MSGFDEQPPDIPHYAGHRERLRKRFQNVGVEALEDYELLELVLFRSVPRQDTKPIAKALISRFGSFAEAIAAPRLQLLEVKGVGEAVAVDLKLLHAASIRITRDELKDRPLLSSWSAVIDYCRNAMAFLEKEQFRILFLDNKNALITDEIHQTGTVDHTPVYPREIVKRALELSAKAIILVHNHPSGDPTPSRGDITMTKEIIAIAEPLEITVHDHIIIGRHGHTSLKGLKLI